MRDFAIWCDFLKIYQKVEVIKNHGVKEFKKKKGERKSEAFQRSTNNWEVFSPYPNFSTFDTAPPSLLPCTTEHPNGFEFFRKLNGTEGIAVYLLNKFEYTKR